MIIRMRIYESQNADHSSGDDVFYQQVKPVHERHGARFVGRYRDKAGRVIVMWSYPDEDTCRRIQAAVANDPATQESAAHRREAGLHGCEHTEFLLHSTEPSE